MSPAQEIARRRTFAIISHPDAGKTTLTEKFLLYGNAIHLAGTVTARKNQRATTSDWMELEKQRGISISSTVLQFDYGGFAVNLLAGDKVSLELSPYDLNKGRITFRHLEPRRPGDMPPPMARRTR